MVLKDVKFLLILPQEVDFFFEVGDDHILLVIFDLEGRVEVGAPFDLFSEDRLPVDHRGALAIAAAQIEPDAAAVEVPANCRGGGALSRQFLERTRFDM